MKPCDHECLVTSCLMLAVLVMVQMAMLAFSYGSVMDDRLRTSIQSYTPILDKTETRRLPSVLIIGVRKGGTRALLDAMALHPNIRVVRKEAHFFDLNYSRGIDWYRSMMPLSTADQVVVEKTPGYFTSAVAPKRTCALVFGRRQHFSRYRAELIRSTTGYGIPLYDLHMTNWLRYFSMEQILLVNGDVFRGNPINEFAVRRVEDVLEFPQKIHNDQLIFNERKGFFCFRRTPRSRVKCLGSTKGRPHREIADETLSPNCGGTFGHTMCDFSAW
ncbi:sulfotransferase domain protein, partial [Ostertagia ostertagi]